MKYVLCIFPCFYALFCDAANQSGRVRQISWEEACHMDFDVELSEKEMREYYPFRYWQGIVEDNAAVLCDKNKNEFFDNIKSLVLCSLDLLLNNECDEDVAYDIIAHFLMGACTSSLDHRRLSSDILEHATSTGISSVVNEERLMKAFSRRMRCDFDVTSLNSDTIRYLVEKEIFCCFGMLFIGYTLFTRNYFESEYFYQKILDKSPKLRSAMNEITKRQ